MPVGKAARAIGSASADGPTDRLLLYLHPSPGVPNASAAKQALEVRGELAAHGARPFDVIRTTIRSLRTKSLLDDLQAIEAHNESVEQQLTDRDRLLAPITSTTPPPPTGETSSVIAPELDAARLVDLFASPWDHVAESVPPVEFAPQAGGRNGEGLDRLTRRLAQELATTTLPRAADLPVLSRNSLRPWGALIRIASLLIEWCRYGGEDARVVDAVGAKKLRLYELRDAAVRTAAVLNVDTLERIPDLPADDAEAARSIVQRRVPEVTGQLDAVVEQWREITSIAAELAALMPRAASSPPARTAAGMSSVASFERLLPPTVSPEQVTPSARPDRSRPAAPPSRRGARQPRAHPVRHDLGQRRHSAGRVLRLALRARRARTPFRDGAPAAERREPDRRSPVRPHPQRRELEVGGQPAPQLLLVPRAELAGQRLDVGPDGRGGDARRPGARSGAAVADVDHLASRPGGLDPRHLHRSAAGRRVGAPVEPRDRRRRARVSGPTT